MTLEIIHLKQVHTVLGIPEYDKQKEICDVVVKSQFELANYLIRNKDIPAVVESLYDNVDCENSSRMCAVTQQFVFPNGLPSSFEKLTHNQKALLYEYGAAIVLTFAGVLPKVYLSIDKDNSDKIDAEVNNLSYEELNLKNITTDAFGNREHFALENAKLAAQDYYGSSDQGKVFIIFGAAHDFNKKCDEFGYELSEVDFSLVLGMQVSSSLHITEGYEGKLLSEKLKTLMSSHPKTTNKLIHSQYVSIEDLSAFAENHFETLKGIVRYGGLIDFIASGVLPLEQSLEVFYDKERGQHLWGIVKDSLLNHTISFDQFLAMPTDQMKVIHSFKTTEEIVTYVTNTVGDMDQATCLWIQ